MAARQRRHELVGADAGPRHARVPRSLRRQLLEPEPRLHARVHEGGERHAGGAADHRHGPRQPRRGRADDLDYGHHRAVRRRVRVGHPAPDARAPRHLLGGARAPFPAHGRRSPPDHQGPGDRPGVRGHLLVHEHDEFRERRAVPADAHRRAVHGSAGRLPALFHALRNGRVLSGSVEPHLEAQPQPGTAPRLLRHGQRTRWPAVVDYSRARHHVRPTGGDGVGGARRSPL